MISVAVTEVSQVAEARRRVAEMAADLGYGATATGRASIVATELATNIVKYGGPGEILVGSYEDDTGNGLEILALDRGPGMADAARSERDGHSTGGSPGNGLGAARRQAETFDIASWPGRGTAIMARIGAVPATGRGAMLCSRPLPASRFRCAARQSRAMSPMSSTTRAGGPCWWPTGSAMDLRRPRRHVRRS